MVDADHKLSDELLGSVLLGNRLAAVEMPATGVWDFHFADAHLNIGVPWRIADGESIRLGSCDHGHKFGLSTPVNAIVLAMEFLAGRRVDHLSLAAKAADLELAFEGGFYLDIFNHSAGWEGWNLTSDNGIQVIALGGGDIAIFRR